jgi:hypothetical protein
LAFAWLSPTVLGLISGPPRIFYYSADTSIGENLEFVNDDFGKLPGFTAVKQDGLYIGVGDPYFGVI